MCNDSRATYVLLEINLVCTEDDDGKQNVWANEYIPSPGACRCAEASSSLSLIGSFQQFKPGFQPNENSLMTQHMLGRSISMLAHFLGRLQKSTKA